MARRVCSHMEILTLHVVRVGLQDAVAFHPVSLGRYARIYPSLTLCPQLFVGQMKNSGTYRVLSYQILTDTVHQPGWHACAESPPGISSVGRCRRIDRLTCSCIQEQRQGSHWIAVMRLLFSAALCSCPGTTCMLLVVEPTSQNIC